MNAKENVRLDDGRVNERILATQSIADYRRVEQASLKRKIALKSPEAKRLFVRYFHTLQLNAHFCSEIARIRLEAPQIEAVEAELRKVLITVANELATATESARLVLEREGVADVASYDTQPLEKAVPIISPYGRRYIDVLEAFDALMPMMKTLEILEIRTPTETDIARKNLKRRVSGPAKTARNLAIGLRRRISQLAEQEVQQTQAAAPSGEDMLAAAISEGQGTHAELLSPSNGETGATATVGENAQSSAASKPKKSAAAAAVAASTDG